MSLPLLAEAEKFGELEIPAKSWVSLYEESGKLERFEVKTPVEVDGQKCKGYTNFLHARCGEEGLVQQGGLVGALHGIEDRRDQRCEV